MPERTFEQRRMEVTTMAVVYATITNSPAAPGSAVQAVVVTDGRAFRVLGGSGSVAPSIAARAHDRFRPGAALIVLRRLVGGLPYTLSVHEPQPLDVTLDVAVERLAEQYGLASLPEAAPPKRTPAEIRAILAARKAARPASAGG
jgi:hypothetical protein